MAFPQGKAIFCLIVQLPVSSVFTYLEPHFESYAMRMNGTLSNKNNYTFNLKVQKQIAVDQLLQASMKMRCPIDCQTNDLEIKLRYNSINELELNDIKAEIVKCSGILKITIVKE
jgi:hypothetical protein